MVRTLPAVVLLGLLLVAARTGDAAQCGDNQFQCVGSGRCLSFYSKCDGLNDCDDGYDEVSCNAFTTTMHVGDVLAAHVQYQQKLHGGILFLLCDDATCDMVWPQDGSGFSNGSLVYNRQTGCDTLGNSCSGRVEMSTGRYFTDGEVVFEMERRASQLAFWLQGRPDKAVTVPVNEKQNILKIRPGYWKSDLPVRISDRRGWRAWSVSQIDPSEVKDTTVCMNGGKARRGVCSCPPGFSGPTCEKACGPNACDSECSGSISECRGQRFCRLDGTCTCAAGYYGERCDEICGCGWYGANCTQQCGYCNGAESCDPYTGQCLQGCLPGYHGPTCLQKLTHLVESPTVTSKTRTSVSGHVQMKTAGSGLVKYIVVQHRETSGGGWISGQIEPLPLDLVDGMIVLPFVVDTLPPDTEVALRALLLDENLDAMLSVPQTAVRTQGPRFLENVTVSEVTEDSLRVSWTLDATKHLVFVEYECVSVAGCSKDCSSSAGRVQRPGSTVLLHGLLPGAKYRVSVRTEDEVTTLTARTSAKVPRVEVSSPRVLAVSNTSAVVQWGSPADCLHQGGPLFSYHWELESYGGGVNVSGRTAATTLPLSDLEPGQQYRLRVGVTNVAGLAEPTNWSAINVTTLHSAPSAPLELAAYRWNWTALWLRWRPPAHPGGTLLHYNYSVLPNVQVQRLPADTRCAAWPDEVCAVVRVAPSSIRHAVAVTATNDKTPQAGHEALATVTSVDGVPGPVEGLEAVPTTSTSVLLRWKLPRFLNGNLRYFETSVKLVNATTADGLNEEAQDDVEKTKEELPHYEKLVEGLRPGASYNVTVLCRGSGGLGVPASKTVTTLTEDKSALEDENITS